MGQDIFDVVVIATILFFALRGLHNGFVGEVAGIFSLFAGFWCARAWHAQLAPYLQFISDPAWRDIGSCVIIFIGAMLCVGILARIIKKIIKFSFAAWLDKLAGLFLGLAKGVLVWALIIIVLDKLFHDAQFMRDSRAIPYFSTIIDHIAKWLPSDFAARAGL